MGKIKYLILVLVGIIIVLLIGLGVAISYIISEKNSNQKFANDLVESENTATINTKENTDEKKYNVTDYIKVEKKSIKGLANNVVSYATLSNLPETIISDFKTKQNNFINQNENSIRDNTFTNNIIYEVKDNILSIYVDETIQNKENTGYKSCSRYSLNVNLINNNLISNDELLGIFKITSEDMYLNVLKNISENVKTNELLLSTDGDITAEKITIETFKTKIPEEAKNINNKTDLITLYIKNGELQASFYQNEILKAIGMGTHMGIGLIQETQSILIK